MSKFQIAELAIVKLGPRSLQDIAVGLLEKDLGLINRTLARAGLPKFETLEDAELYLPSPETLGYVAHAKFKMEFYH